MDRRIGKEDLFNFEKEEYIGLFIAESDNKISTDMLDQLDFSIEKIRNNEQIKFYYFEGKLRKGELNKIVE